MLYAGNKILTEFEGYIPVRDVQNRKQRIWNGEKWEMAEIVPYGRTARVNVDLKNHKRIVCSEETEFLTPNGFKDYENIYFENLILSYKRIEFDSVIEYQYPKMQILSKFELGLMLGYIKNAVKKDGTLIFKTEERNYKMNDHLGEMLSKLCESVRYTQYRYWFNYNIFETKDTNLLGLKSIKVPQEVYYSSQTMKGYLQALFNQGQETRTTIKIKGGIYFLYEIKHLLMLRGVHSHKIKKGLRICNSDLEDFIFRVGFSAEKFTKKKEKLIKSFFKVTNQNWMPIQSAIRHRKTHAKMFEIKASQYMTEGAICRN